MGIWKKDPIKTYDNQLGKLDQEELWLMKRLEDVRKLKADTLDNRRNAGPKKYMNAGKRNNLLSEAERLGYSHDEIARLKKCSDDWNQDNISNEVIDEFENLGKYIKSQASYKDNLLYKVCDILSLGGNENEN